jgi:hypothetical protein
MYCEKYHATIPEKTCIARQKRAKTHVMGRYRGDPGCADCEQGKAISMKGAATDMEEKQIPETDPIKSTGMRAMRVCKKCGEKKALDEFYKNSQCRDGREGACKACKNAAKRKPAAAKTPFRTVAAPPVEPPGKLVAYPVLELPYDEPVLVVSFENHPELLDAVRTAAADELRTDEAQVLYWIRETVRFNRLTARETPLCD